MVRVALNANGGQGSAEIRKRFEQEYDRLYGHTQPDGVIEISNQRVVGTGLLPELTVGASEHAITEPVPLETRSVYVSPEIGWQDIPVFAGDALRPGHVLDGPLLVEERTTTVLVESGNRLQVDDADNLILELQVNEA